MTSVKEFRVDATPTRNAPGRGRFYFTDDYSVFDWGRMPDEIPEKGASLCTMGAYNFELLETEGVPTHYRGVVPTAGGRADPVALDDVDAPPREMAIELATVPDLPSDGREYDYAAYHRVGGDCYVVPLEVVFRNTVPEGSSLRRRTDPADHGLDVAAWPEAAVELDEPVVEFSTKYEDGDRYLDRAEADRIAGKADVADLERLAREVNRVVTDRADDVGMVHQDGKIECVYVGGELLVADVVGTFDENRFAYDGQQVSKEVLRRYYRRTQPEWVEAVETAKAEAKERGVADWKSVCRVAPGALPGRVVTAARDLYAAGTNRYVGRELFDAPSLDAAVEAVRAL